MPLKVVLKSRCLICERFPLEVTTTGSFSTLPHLFTLLTPSRSSTGSILGYGLRNEVGLTEDGAGNILGVENSFDDAYRLVNGVQKDVGISHFHEFLFYLRPNPSQVHTDNPSEKLHVLGNPQAANGTWYGYPTCGLVWEPSVFTDKTFQPGDW